MLRCAMQASRVMASTSLNPCAHVGCRDGHWSATRLHSVARPSVFGGRRSCTAQAGSESKGPLEEKERALAEDEVIFAPFESVSHELANVEQAKLGQKGADNSFARVFYAPEAEYAVNEQINIEYNMHYVYTSLFNYFNRDNVALPGFAKFFLDSSFEERDHAQQLMDFQATRGGRVQLARLTAPESEFQHSEKGDALHAMEIALSLEKLNFSKLRDLHEVAEKTNDAQMADFVEDMLAEQVKGVKSVADYVAQLRRAGPGLGVFEFDRALQASPMERQTQAVSSA